MRLTADNIWIYRFKGASFHEQLQLHLVSCLTFPQTAQTLSFSNDDNNNGDNNDKHFSQRLEMREKRCITNLTRCEGENDLDEYF